MLCTPAPLRERGTSFPFCWWFLENSLPAGASSYHHRSLAGNPARGPVADHPHCARGLSVSLFVLNSCPLSPSTSAVGAMRFPGQSHRLPLTGGGSYPRECMALPPAPPRARRRGARPLPPPMHLPTALAVALLASLTVSAPVEVASAAAHPPAPSAHRDWPWAVNATAPLYARGVALAGAFRHRRPGPSAASAATPGGGGGQWWRPLRNRSAVAPPAGAARDGGGSRGSSFGGGGGGSSGDGGGGSSGVVDRVGRGDAAASTDGPVRRPPASGGEGRGTAPRDQLTPGVRASVSPAGGGIAQTLAPVAPAAAATKAPMSASPSGSHAPPHGRPDTHPVYDAGEPLPPLPTGLVGAAARAATDWARPLARPPPPPRPPPLRSSTVIASPSAGVATASAACPPQPLAGVRRTPVTRPSRAATGQRRVVANHRRRAERQRRQQRRRRLHASGAPPHFGACGIEGGHASLPARPPRPPRPEVVVTARHCGYACEEVLLRVAGVCGPPPPGRGGTEEEEDVVFLWAEDDGREVAVPGRRPRRCTEVRVFLQCVPKYVGGAMWWGLQCGEG